MRRNGENLGVKYGPLTSVEIGTLQALAEGMTPVQIAAETRVRSARTVWRRLERLRLKLGAYTNYEMMFKVGKEGILE
jgi:DNA-binding NarL/FixJ family response regulator